MISGKAQGEHASLKMAEQFILETLRGRRSLSLRELAHMAAINEPHLSPEETRGAAAVLVDQGKIRLTDDLQVRLVATP